MTIVLRCFKLFFKHQLLKLSLESMWIELRIHAATMQCEAPALHWPLVGLKRPIGPIAYMHRRAHFNKVCSCKTEVKQVLYRQTYGLIEVKHVL